MDFSPANLAALTAAISFAAGLNVYATLLTLGLLSRFHVVALPSGLDLLTHTWVLIVCGVLFTAEFFADKVPVLDLFWNALHTFVRVPVAGLVAWQATSHLPPGMQLLSTSAGAAIALLAHGSKTALRAAVTPSPEPISNIVLSTTEDATAIGLTWLAAHHPIAAASVALFGIAAAVFAARALYRALQKTFARLRSRPAQAAAGNLPAAITPPVRP